METNRLTDIAAFVLAVRTGSFTAAADQLGSTRSAVSKSVARLEARHDVRLLNRSTRTLSLTDEGAIAFERWQQILDDLEEVDATMAQRKGRPTGLLKLTAPLSFGQRYILPVLDDYLRQWPEVRAHVSFSDRFVDLIEEGYDIAVRIGEPDENSLLMGRTIACQQFVTCAAPAYLERRGTPHTPAEIAEHDAIVFLSADKPRPWQFQGSGAPLLIPAPGRLNLDSSEAMRSAALAGFGLVNLPTYILGEDLQQGHLVEVLRDWRATPDPIRLMYPSRRHLSPRVRSFIDLLAERWGEHAPWEASPGCA
ncbi:LysR family transcriptional regulator [Comamonas sp. Tr-654]|uniref:LysR family transcriptional regulator n=1 Tax=Comamonas sp. Tr-654 TaxID=2608341 RepID=UPI00142209D3|nr:LysR family transcriptional regulator [Comamonas sp. Tr-654]NIF85802.1 LysR family transcriptional regulator [Comamonas sp. Tr-654]